MAGSSSMLRDKPSITSYGRPLSVYGVREAIADGQLAGRSVESEYPSYFGYLKWDPSSNQQARLLAAQQTKHVECLAAREVAERSVHRTHAQAHIDLQLAVTCIPKWVSRHRSCISAKHEIQTPNLYPGEAGDESDSPLRRVQAARTYL